MTELAVRTETWPLRGSFTISRGSRTAAEVVVVELAADGVRGRGECVPYARYGETVEGVVAVIEGLRGPLSGGLDRSGLQDLLPAGAARNAVDCAFWDLEAKQAGHRVWELLGQAAPGPVTTAYTLSLDTAENMARAAAENAWRPLLKLKLAGPEDLARVEAVREAAPETRLIVDANEGWAPGLYAELAPHLAVLGVEMIEQPLPAGHDAALATMQRPVAVAADESCHDTASLAEALRLKAAAEAEGYGVMVGCMLATSLAMAPAFLVARDARIVDLDGPLLLERDRPEGLVFEGSLIHPPEPNLWG
jgi:L-alanine-DL-glutamate epimerase-like enolase superfamily enzyme